MVELQHCLTQHVCIPYKTVPSLVALVGDLRTFFLGSRLPLRSSSSVETSRTNGQVDVWIVVGGPDFDHPGRIRSPEPYDADTAGGFFQKQGLHHRNGRQLGLTRHMTWWLRECGLSTTLARLFVTAV